MRKVNSYFYATEGNIQITRNFKVSEFHSRNDSIVLVETELVDTLQKLRDTVGKPINVNSGYRTTSHNTSVGGSKNSAHLLGCAADISCVTVSATELARALAKLFGQQIAIGLHTDYNYVHVDTVYRGNWYHNMLDNKVKSF